MSDEQDFDGAIKDLDKEEFGLEDKANYPMLLMIAFGKVNSTQIFLSPGKPEPARQYINAVIAYARTGVLAMKEETDKKHVFSEIKKLQSLKWGDSRSWYDDGIIRAGELFDFVSAKADHVFLKKTKVVIW